MTNRIWNTESLSTPQLQCIAKELEWTTGTQGTCLKPILDKSINGLEVTGTSEEIIVRYSQPAYLYRAMGLITEQHQPVFHLQEEARFDTNGVMVDCSRNGVMNLSAIEKTIRLMALMGLNQLMLYTEDTYEIPGEPYFGYMRGRYSMEELRHLDAYAADYGVELVPCIQTLGHMQTVLQWPCYLSLRETSDILLADEPKTYALIRRMLTACRDTFSTRRIHIGMDEAEMVGRGRHYEKWGNCDRFDLLCRHLNKVADLCRELGLEPMIWSDMFFKLANDGNYRGHNPVPPEIAARFPADVRPVYWEYLREEPEQYDTLIKNHLALSKRTVFAGGAWKWMSFMPSITPSLRRTRTALTACNKNGIRDVFLTAWGDDGADASFFSILPVLQLQGELGFHGEISNEQLAVRFATCTGGNLTDFMTLDMPEVPPEENNGLLNPNKYLLYQDVLLGLFDRHLPSGTGERYALLAERALAVADKAGPWRELFDTAHALFSVLATKADIGVQIKAAYDADDRTALDKLANEVMPELLWRVEKFHRCLQAQWMAENKPHGFEVQDQRLGGLLLRLKSVARRLNDYLAGQVNAIPELEEDRLPYIGDAESHTHCNHWASTISPGYV